MNKTIIAIAILVVAGATGGIIWSLTAKDDDTPQNNDQSTVQSQDVNSESGSTEQSRGTVTAGGTAYVLTEVVRCEPLVNPAVDTTLELQGRGTSSDGERIQLDVEVRTIGGAESNEVSWSGPEGVFGMGEQTSTTVNQTDNRASGSVTLVDALTFEGSIQVDYDIEVPATTQNCR